MTKVVQATDDWAFFRRGNANALFKYIGNNQQMMNKLLRLRLRKDDTEYMSTEEVYTFIERTCRQSLSKSLIDCEITRVSPKLLAALVLQGHDVSPSERFGLIIPNILSKAHTSIRLAKNCYIHIEKSENEAGSSISLELKPKWLYDNDSLYCRNCSLKQLKGHDRHFCPLDFLHDDTIHVGVHDFLSRIPFSCEEDIAKTLPAPLGVLMEEYLREEGNIFQKLKTLQSTSLPPLSSLSDPSDVSDDLLRVMSFRDVSVIIRFERLTQGVISPKKSGVRNGVVDILNGSVSAAEYVFDTDPKPRAKLKYWQQTHAKLLPICNRDNPHWKHCFRSSS